jgi:hypothetical protein
MEFNHVPHPMPFVLCGFNGCNALIAADTRHDSYLHHLLAVHAGLSPFLLSSPSMTCKIDACTATLPIERNYAWLGIHLVYGHGYLLDNGDGNVETTCRWRDCGTKLTLLTGPNASSNPTGYSQPLIVAQPWQGRSSDLLDHITAVHLSFADLCSTCGSGPFSRRSSKLRHEAMCKGRVPARCKVCLREFPSIIALGGHAELGLCWPLS